MEASKLRENLMKTAESSRISHAYILEGPEEATFKTAIEFAEALISTKADLILTEHEKSNLFSVEDVREQITKNVTIRPYGSKKKVYVVRDAGKMNIQAQNALLKTLEEPPEYVVILLLADNAEVFLNTILSRCVRLNVYTEEEGYPEDSLEMVGKFQDLLKTGRRLSTQQILEVSREFGKNKQYSEPCFLFLKQWFRDVLYTKAGQAPEKKDNITAWRAYAKAMSYEDINRMIQTIDEGRARMNANVNPELTMDVILSKIQEVL